MNKTKLNLKSLLINGFLIWLVPFVAASLLFPALEGNRIIFKSLVMVVLTAAVTFFAARYFRGIKESFVLEAVRASVVWLLMSIAIDLPVFLFAFKMKAFVYFSEIATGYLIIMIVPVGFGKLLSDHKQ